VARARYRPPAEPRKRHGKVWKSQLFQLRVVDRQPIHRERLYSGTAEGLAQQPKEIHPDVPIGRGDQYPLLEQFLRKGRKAATGL